MLVLEDSSLFREILTKEISTISTSFGVIFHNSLRGDKIDLTLHFGETNLLFFCDYNKGNFFENDSGDVFYDFRVEKSTKDVQIECQKELNFGKIEAIDIYSRHLEKSDFKDYPLILKLLGSLDRTEDLFLFNFSSKKRLLIAFHPFLAGLEAFFTEDSISSFFEEYGCLYKKEHSIE